MDKVKVYFTKEITPESLVKIYEAVGKDLSGNVGVKISTGEPGGHNYLKPELIKDLVNKLNGIIVENCTAYGGKRQALEDHLKCVEDHGFTKIAKVDILDAEGEFSIPTREGSKHKRKIIYSLSRFRQFRPSSCVVAFTCSRWFFRINVRSMFSSCRLLW